MPMNFIFGNYNKILGTTHVKAIKSHDFSKQAFIAIKSASLGIKGA